MQTDTPPTLFVNARLKRKASNKLWLSFTDGPGEPLAVALQGGGQGFGSSLLIALGLRNGGLGKHSVKLRGGEKFIVTSGYQQPTTLSRSGSVFASIERGDASVATTPDGTVVLRLVADPEAPKTDDLYRMRVQDAAGAQLGVLDIIRRSTGWVWGSGDNTSIGRGIVDVLSFDWDLSSTTTSLPMPWQGTRLVISEPITDLQREILLAACVDVGIGLRPYNAAMRGNLKDGVWN